MKRILVAMIILLIAVSLNAQEIVLYWSLTDSSVVDEVAGYKIHAGLESGVYDVTITLGDTNAYSFDTGGQQYYFVVNYFRTDGTEGGYSNEIKPTNQSDFPYFTKLTTQPDGLHAKLGYHASVKNQSMVIFTENNNSYTKLYDQAMDTSEVTIALADTSRLYISVHRELINGDLLTSGYTMSVLSSPVNLRVIE